MKKILIWLLFFVGLFTVLGFWYSGLYSSSVNSNISLFKNISSLGALLAVYFILWQIILISRASWVEQTFGFDKLSVAHHYGGIISTIFILIHGIFIVSAFAITQNISILTQFVKFFSNDELLSAIISSFLFITIVVISLTIVFKRLKYENWYYIHIITYVAIALAFGHQLEIGHDFQNSFVFKIIWIAMYIFALGNLIWCRFSRPIINLYKYSFEVSRIEKDTDESVSIYIKGNRISEFKIEAGQFVIFRFLQKGFWKEAHPFSISSGINSNELRITVKNLGDFTANISKLKLKTKILIDGPLGIFTKKVLKSKKVLLIAGGVGITPVYSLASELLSLGIDVSLLYSSKESKSIILKSDIDILSENYSNFKKHFIISNDESWDGEKGRINIEKINHLAPDFLEREVYICGPKGMTSSVVDNLKELGIKKDKIHFERFSFS